MRNGVVYAGYGPICARRGCYRVGGTSYVVPAHGCLLTPEMLKNIYRVNKCVSFVNKSIRVYPIVFEIILGLKGKYNVVRCRRKVTM